MPQPSLEAEFLDRLYGVAMEPERFTELVDIWHRRIELAHARGSHAGQEDLDHLASHLVRADRLLDLAVDREDVFPRPLQQKLEAEPHPMLAFDLAGTIVATNRAAVRQFGECEGQSVSQLPFDAETRDALSRIARGHSDRQRGHGARLVRAIDERSDQPALLSLASWDTAGGRSVLLLKQVDFKWSDHLSDLIRDAFGLTEAETSVMRLMAEGLPPAEIARERSASLATVRTQIRAIYEKTGTRSQGEFLRMALGLGSLDLANKDWLTGALTADTPLRATAHPRPSELRLFELPDGRVLEYAEFGASEGPACLFFHNEFFGPAWPLAAVERAEQLGMRIITPLRPCYGRSSCPIDGSATPETTARDLLLLLDDLRVDRVVPLFQMAGGIFALALAKLAPERVAGLAICAPIFPFAMPEDDSLLSPFHRFLSNTIHRHPRLLEFIVRTGFSFHQRVGSKRFLATFARDHPEDLSLLEDNGVLADMINGMAYCAAHGHRGFFTDYRAPPDDAWGDFMALDKPIACLVGDRIDPKRNLPVERLIEHHPRAERVVAEGGAHYLHFSHPEHVAQLVARVWERAAERA